MNMATAMTWLLILALFGAFVGVIYPGQAVF